MIIKKTDFATYCDFTANTSDRHIDFQIDRAKKFDLKPLFDVYLFEDLYSLGEVSEWDDITRYNVGDKVQLEGIFYRALTDNLNADPLDDPTDWAECELLYFFHVYVKPFVIMAAYVRHLVKLGATATQFGLTQINEETSSAISDKRRGEILAAEKNIMEQYKAGMLEYLSDVRFIFDEVHYVNKGVKKRNNFGIKAI